MAHRINIKKEQPRTFGLSVRLGASVKRFWGLETLCLDCDSVCLDRLNASAPLLLADRIVGVVVPGSAQIRSDLSLLAADVRVGDTTDGENVLAAIAAGILTEESFAMDYLVRQARLEEAAGSEDTWLVTLWEPVAFRISPTPAALGF